MRFMCVGVLMFFPSLVFAGPLAPRPVDRIASDTLTAAIAQSAAVRALVSALASSNVIAHIESSRQLPLGIGGTTRFVTSRGGYRYVRITIGAHLTPKARIAILGHELQHACEVAASEAADALAVRRLFEQRGHRHGMYYETSAAIAMERRIQRELGERSQATLTAYRPSQ